jgi:hypothetical protein
VRAMGNLRPTAIQSRSSRKARLENHIQAQTLPLILLKTNLFWDTTQIELYIFIKKTETACILPKNHQPKN